MTKIKYLGLLPGLLSLPIYAAEPAEMVKNIQEIRISLDSVWVVMGGILVFFMQAGFALIESGSVRSKNSVNVLMKNYMDACLGGLDQVKDKVINFVQKVITDPVGTIKEVAEVASKSLHDKIAETEKGAKALSKVGETTAKTLAFLGNKDAQDAVAANEGKLAVTAKGLAVDVAKGVHSTVKRAVAGKELKLSEQDIIDIMKVASTEVVPSLKGKAFEDQAAGVVDTILNRAASGKYGNGVRGVVNQRWAFSDINAPRKGAYGSVQNVPMKRVSKRMEKFVRDYLTKRANGLDSSVGRNVSYANPYYLGEASAATKKWVREVEKQADKTGQRFGAGKAIHVHGTPSADRHKMPSNYHIAIPGGGSQTLNNLGGSSTVPIRNIAPPSSNPHKSQVNTSNMSASNVTIHQSFKTDMTLNGVSSPVEAANAVQRQQENSMVIAARGAKSLIG